jgi:hypothetical protein
MADSQWQAIDGKGLKGGTPCTATVIIRELIPNPGNVDEVSLPLSSHGELAGHRVERHARS